MSNLRSCQTCHDLTPLSDEGTKISLSAIARAATAGCDSCRLLRHAIHDCVPQALVPRRGSHGVGTVDVVIRQAIMRHFVEVMVRWNESNSIILDLFVATSMCNLAPHGHTNLNLDRHVQPVAECPLWHTYIGEHDLC
jgi:hypothetical protein